ncbi:MAG: molybdopterin-dependent oxidoreductase [Deltaproteobacteria bacterium]|nr:molybdopterin-dependent oxidoreductase [Deltaproteobacteria bacterium]
MTHHRTCTACEAMCGLLVEVDGDRVVGLRGDDGDPLGRGFMCEQAWRLVDQRIDPQRVRRPLRRRTSTAANDAGFEEVGWDVVLDDIAQRIAALQKQHGHDALAVFAGRGVAHDHGALLFSALFIETLKTERRYSLNSCDTLPQLLAALLMFGHQGLVPVPDLDRAHLVLLLGANPVLSHGSIIGAPDARRRLGELRARGGKLVVVDPRRSETAALADQHVAIRPGTDALLLLALVHTLFADGLVAPAGLAGFTDGIDAVRQLAQPFSPDAVAARTGVPAAITRALARDFAAAPAAVCHGRSGVTAQEHGALTCWLINVVNILTGNLDRPGGAMFGKPAVDMVDVATKIGAKGSHAGFRSRVRGLPEFGGDLPAATLAEELETPGPGQLRGLVVFDADLTRELPAGPRVERALSGLELLICITDRLDDTSRQAHFVLPPAPALEREHFDMVLGMAAQRNVAKVSPPVFAPAPDARHAWQIYLELATRVAAQRGWLASKAGAASRAVMRRLGPGGLVDWALKLGPYKGLSLKKLAATPSGLDLGALEPCLPKRLETRGRRIQLAPALLLADAARLGALLDSAAPSLQLVLHQPPMQRGQAPTLAQPLLMHPDDAAARGLASQEQVRVSSQAGSIVTRLELTADMMQGVVSLARDSRVDTSALSDDQRVDPLAGTAVFASLAVTVSAAD